MDFGDGVLLLRQEPDPVWRAVVREKGGLEGGEGREKRTRVRVRGGILYSGEFGGAATRGSWVFILFSFAALTFLLTR